MKKIFIPLLVVFAFAFCISSVSATPYSKNLITNGNFENGINGWYGYYVDSTANIYTDSVGSYLGMGYYGYEQFIRQTISVPSDAQSTKLIFDYTFLTDDWAQYDYFYVDVRDHSTQEQILYDYRYDSDGEIDWTKVKYTLNSVAGKNLDVYFGIYNDDYYATSVYLDDIVVRAKSKSDIGITVKSGGKAVKNATVKLKTAKGKVLQSKTTNSNGKLTFSGVKNYSSKVKITASKSGFTKTVRKLIKLGKQYNYTINL